MLLRVKNQETHISYWRAVSHQLVDICLNEGFSVRDVYLVGSQVAGYKVNSDYDSVIIINEDAPPIHLKALHRILHDYAFSHADQYHFKVFSLTGLLDCCRYDGFRIASFQRSNVSLLSSRSLDTLCPIMDRISFANSILIQCVYGYFHSEYTATRFDYITARMTKWIRVNNELLAANTPGKSLQLEELLSTSSLLNCFYQKLRKQPELARPDMLIFLKRYFVQIPHEWVNKSNIYLNYFSLKDYAHDIP